jgi:DNA polymerase III epsilon subunit-like protein
MNLFFLDFETTGLNVYQDHIIEIAIKQIENKKSYQKLVIPKPQPKGLVKYVPLHITKLTGISDEHIVKEGIEPCRAFQKMIEYMKQYSDTENPIYIISHNGNSFDFIFLRRLIKEHHKEDYKSIVDRLQFIDTVLMAKLIYYKDRVNQKALCQKYNIPINVEHRALDDIINLEKMYTCLCLSLNKLHNKEELHYNNHPNEVCDLLCI